MRIGVPTEVKQDEHRVALTPAGARELVSHGHEVLVQTGAGEGSGLPDDAYAAQGATILPDADATFARAELIVKVKEPQPAEVARLREDQVLFTYLHLAPDAALTQGLIDSGATCIAYETIEDRNGRLPLLAPMSEVAGRLAAQAGARVLERPQGGRGVLMGGVPGVPGAQVVIIGGGVVGLNAAIVAVGMQAEVTLLDRDIDRLRELDLHFGGRAQVAYASALAIEEAIGHADLVVGAVLVHGAKAPHVVRRDQLAGMRPGAALLDVAIDQGGCFETSRPTTHTDPTYVVDGIVHYCVANMPGATPATSTMALTNATTPYLLRLADLGARRALEADPGFLAGLNVAGGAVTYAPVASDQGRQVVEPDAALAAA